MRRQEQVQRAHIMSPVRVASLARARRAGAGVAGWHRALGLACLLCALWLWLWGCAVPVRSPWRGRHQPFARKRAIPVAWPASAMRAPRARRAGTQRGEHDRTNIGHRVRGIDTYCRAYAWQKWCMIAVLQRPIRRSGVSCHRRRASCYLHACGCRRPWSSVRE